ncbi:uridine kinase family protein [Domibacillus indicus]|uniref:uridine kinase family protein n=1 Tax=Domibacillus indicus TaxID=1437523 RepID=UPI00061805D5|nr:AAA family ATPase [Domibacillus indicus]
MSLKQLIASFSKNGGQTFIIAIDGCGGAGKSTLAGALQKELGNTAVIVHADDFYQVSSKRNSSIGGSWDLNRLENQLLKPLRQNMPARYERYDWETDQLAEIHAVPPGGFVIVEGCYTMLERFLPYYNFKIWVDSPREIRLQRGIERDGEGLRSMWEDVWMPGEQVYIQEQYPAGAADIIISGTSGEYVKNLLEN